MDLSEHFERIYGAIAESKVYRDAIRSSMADLPDWVIPFSITGADDLAMIAAELHVHGGDCFVDLACGLGGLGLWIAERTGASLVGVDVSNSAVKAASALAADRRLSEKARFKVADITDTGLSDGEFDGLMSIDAIQFVDPQRVVSEIARLLRPGASAVVRTLSSTFPQWDKAVYDWGSPH